MIQYHDTTVMGDRPAVEGYEAPNGEVVKGPILAANVHFERVAWSRSREGRPGKGAAVSFFDADVDQRGSHAETASRISGSLDTSREARFKDAVVAFRKRCFYDHNVDLSGCSRLVGVDGAANVVARELSVVTKQL